jgi:hypothetical protein
VELFRSSLLEIAVDKHDELTASFKSLEGELRDAATEARVMAAFVCGLFLGTLSAIAGVVASLLF